MSFTCVRSSGVFPGGGGGRGGWGGRFDPPSPAPFPPRFAWARLADERGLLTVLTAKRLDTAGCDKFAFPNSPGEWVREASGQAFGVRPRLSGCVPQGDAHAGSRTRVTSMGGLYDAATLRALKRRFQAFGNRS